MAALYLIAGTLVLSFSTLTYTGSLGGEKFFGFLGKLSMPIYCIHWGVYRVVSAASKFIPVKNYYALMGIAFAGTVIISVLMMLILAKAGKRKKTA
jgi:peptidoglycan/LPS O-acetylase OafA/YrhL